MKAAATALTIAAARRGSLSVAAIWIVLLSGLCASASFPLIVPASRP